jgi:hypothetical protein
MIMEPFKSHNIQLVLLNLLQDLIQAGELLKYLIQLTQAITVRLQIGSSTFKRHWTTSLDLKLLLPLDNLT